MIKEWLKVRKCYKLGHMYSENGITCPFTGTTTFIVKIVGVENDY